MTGRAIEAVADVPSLLRGPHHLANQRVGLSPGATSIANKAELDTDVVVIRAQGRSPPRQCGDGDQRVETVG